MPDTYFLGFRHDARYTYVYTYCVYIYTVCISVHSDYFKVGRWQSVPAVLRARAGAK